jgi:hypothetical protein
MNEVKAHARADIPVKPGYLVAYENIERFRIPVWTGGLMDQPHLWLLEYEVIDQMMKLFDALDNRPKAQVNTNAV